MLLAENKYPDALSDVTVKVTLVEALAMLLIEIIQRPDEFVVQVPVPVAPLLQAPVTTTPVTRVCVALCGVIVTVAFHFPAEPRVVVASMLPA